MKIILDPPHAHFTDDEEIVRHGRPLPLAALYNTTATTHGLIPMLKWGLWQVLWVEPTPQGGWPPAAHRLRISFKVIVGKLLGQLYDLNSRARVMPVTAFHTEHLPAERLRVELQAGAKEGPVGTIEGPRGWEVLRHAPFLVPFEERAAVFQMVVAADREVHRDMDLTAQLMEGQGRFVTIRRATVLEDAFRQLYGMGSALKV